MSNTIDMRTVITELHEQILIHANSVLHDPLKDGAMMFIIMPADKDGQAGFAMEFHPIPDKDMYPQIARLMLSNSPSPFHFVGLISEAWSVMRESVEEMKGSMSEQDDKEEILFILIESSDTTCFSHHFIKDGVYQDRELQFDGIEGRLVSGSQTESSKHETCH